LNRITCFLIWLLAVPEGRPRGLSTSDTDDYQETKLAGKCGSSVAIQEVAVD
jgi:hypothetical protein